MLKQGLGQIWENSKTKKTAEMYWKTTKLGCNDAELDDLKTLLH